MAVQNAKATRNKLLLAAGALAGVCVLCAIGAMIFNATPAGKASATRVAIREATQTAMPTTTDQPTRTSASTSTPRPTRTPIPTSTPRPTKTPAPTKTEAPTSTPTQPPEPIEFTGTGDDVVDFEKWDGPALLHLTYTGGRNFIVKNFDGTGQDISLLVNMVGRYDGTIPLDFMDGEDTARLQITASGPWTAQVLPLSSVRTETVPGIYFGAGDDVIRLTGGKPDVMAAEGKGRSNFIIYGFTDGGRDLLLNEISPYQGKVMLDQGTFILVVHSEGEWTLDVSAR